MIDKEPPIHLQRKSHRFFGTEEDTLTLRKYISDRVEVHGHLEVGAHRDAPLLSDFHLTITPTSPARLVIVMAAGHGTRMHSRTSKLLHEIWGRPTVLRALDNISNGLGPDTGQIIIVGQKAAAVSKRIGSASNRAFVFQAEQKGTGHAAMVGMDYVRTELNAGTTGQEFRGPIYIFSGDQPLFRPSTLADEFKACFEAPDSTDDILLLSATYSGDPYQNHYGRVVRDKSKPKNVVGIVEWKDIKKMNPDDQFHGYSKDELVQLREYSTVTFAVRGPLLANTIFRITNKNATGEYYLGDVITLAIQEGKNVRAVKLPPDREWEAHGFNDPYDRDRGSQFYRDHVVIPALHSIVTLPLDRNFFIADDVVERLVSFYTAQDADGDLPEEGRVLDKLTLGIGSYVGEGVRFDPRAENIVINGRVEGPVEIGSRVTINGHVQGRMVLCDGVTVEGKLVVTGSRPLVVSSGTMVTGNHVIDTDRFEASPVALDQDIVNLRLMNTIQTQLANGIRGVFSALSDDDLMRELGTHPRKVLKWLVGALEIPDTRDRAKNLVLRVLSDHPCAYLEHPEFLRMAAFVVNDKLRLIKALGLGGYRLLLGKITSHGNGPGN